MSCTAPAVETRGLTKRFGPHRAVDKLDLTVAPGEVVGLLGSNGASKSTTMRMLVDLLRPTAGTVRVLGVDPARSVEVRQRIGYLPGELGLDGRAYVHEVLRLLGRLHGHPHGAAAPQRRDELVERLDLDTSRRIRELSTGNRQKVGIVAALQHRPELLVLDEPTRGLDPLMQQEFLALLREARADGAAVLLSSHVLSEVAGIADRVAIIRDGRLVTDSAGQRLASLVRLELTFLEPPADELLAGVPGVADLEWDGTVLRCTLDGAADDVVKVLAGQRVDRLQASRPDLEDLFLAQYGRDDAGVRA